MVVSFILSGYLCCYIDAIMTNKVHDSISEISNGASTEHDTEKPFGKSPYTCIDSRMPFSDFTLINLSLFPCVPLCLNFGRQTSERYSAVNIGAGG